MREAISNDERTGSSIFQRDPSYLETLGLEFVDMTLRTPVLTVRVWPRHEKNWQQKKLRKIGFQVERDKVQLAYEEQVVREEELTTEYLDRARAAFRAAAERDQAEIEQAAKDAAKAVANLERLVLASRRGGKGFRRRPSM